MKRQPIHARSAATTRGKTKRRVREAAAQKAWNIQHAAEQATTGTDKHPAWRRYRLSFLQRTKPCTLHVLAVDVANGVLTVGTA